MMGCTPTDSRLPLWLLLLSTKEWLTAALAGLSATMSQTLPRQVMESHQLARTGALV